MAGNWRGEFKAAACAGLFSMPVGILQFVPLFHYFRDVHHLHAEPTMIALGGIYLLVGKGCKEDVFFFNVVKNLTKLFVLAGRQIAFYGVNRAKPRNLLEVNFNFAGCFCCVFFVVSLIKGNLTLRRDVE